MAETPNFNELPANLPVPQDDGAADHLQGLPIPPLSLPSTDGEPVSLAAVATRTVVFYCYPLTGRPGQPLPSGWDEIPGARGCTPQSCAFRDHHAELTALGTSVFGISTQTTDYQREFAERSHLPFVLLSDPALSLARELRLPTFEVDGMTLYRRLTLIVVAGVIAKVFYPVFPPDKNADEALAWLAASTAEAG